VIGRLLAGKIVNRIYCPPQDHHAKGSPSTRFIAVSRSKSFEPKL
jgi:hypothetical protein